MSAGLPAVVQRAHAPVASGVTNRPISVAMTSQHSLRALFDPRAVAVIGASPDLGKPGGRSLSILRAFGFPGAIYPINGRYKEIGGLPCFPDLATLPGPIDLAIVLVPAKAVPEYVRAAGAAGARAAVICTSGFAEAGAEGRALQDELVAAANAYGMAILGPNGLGMVDLHHNLAATFSTAFAESMATKAGPIAFLSQSGAMGAAVFFIAQNEGIGIGKFLSTGNEAVQDFSDYLSYLGSDPDVSVIMGYMEGIRDGRRFVEAARAARAAGKHVAILKVGQSEAGGRAAQSHTGALVGSAQVFDAAFRRAGIVAVPDVRTLVDLGVALPGRWPTRGRRVGIVSSSGGAGVMMTDRCASSGLTVAPLAAQTQRALADVLPPFVGMANPVDYGPVYGDPEAIRRCIMTVGADPAVDLVLFFLGLSPGMAGTIEPLLAKAQEDLGKPILATWLGGPAAGLAALRERGVAAFDDPSRTVSVAVALAQTAAPPPTLAATPPDAARARNTQAALRAFMAAGRASLTEREVKDLLRPYGLALVEEVFVRDAGEAAAQAHRWSVPLAVKAEAPALVHKSDAGAVRLNVAPPDVAQALAEVIAAAARVVGVHEVRGAVLQPMVEPGLEILAGLRHDPQFGPTITVGLGGVTSEVLGDVSTELAPIDRALARDMLERLRSARLLAAFRGAPARDVEALAAALVGLSQFACDAGAMIGELDLNPIIVHAQGRGCTVVDGAAILGSDSAKR